MPTNVNRGNESNEHRLLKKRVGELLESNGWIVAFEYKNADIIAFDITQNLTIAVEIERSERNCIRNLNRNFNMGVDKVVIVAVGNVTERRIRSLVSKHFNAKKQFQVSIINEYQLQNIEEM